MRIGSTGTFAAYVLTSLLAGPASAEETEADPVWPAACPMSCSCGPGHRWWVDGEYLLWKIKDGPIPGPLVTTGSLADPVPGALGQPSTVVLYGQDELDYKPSSGFRLMFGGWFDRQGLFGFEADGFMLETHTIHFEANADDAGSPFLARPFISTLDGRQQAAIITAPTAALGGIDIFSDSRFWGGEGDFLVGGLVTGPGTRFDLLAGFRYLGLKDELRFSQSSTLLANGQAFFDGDLVLAPDIISIRDLFETLNQFFGGQVGLRGETRWGPLTLGGVAKAGIGSTRQDVKITGHTALTDSTGLTHLRQGGLYSQDSNIGWYNRDEFSFVGELGVRLGWQIFSFLNAHVGYTLLYWDNVARPGDQITQVINPRIAPTNSVGPGPLLPLQPSHVYRSTNFWAQGLTVGFELRY
jgi:hypothetical protein